MTTYLKAYQAYTQKKYDHCLKLLQEIKQNDVKKLDLQAQVYFQKKDYQKAYDIYQELIETKRDEFTNERRENVETIIACSQLEYPGKLKPKSREQLPQAAEIADQVQQINLTDSSVSDLFSKQKSSKGNNKRHKKRKQKLPKNYNPNVAPDPERWLPMRDRKSAAHRQKKRRQRPNQRGKGGRGK